MRARRPSVSGAALEAAELAPPTEATLQELIALHPPQFVPTDCPHRAAVDEGVAAARRKHGWKQLDFKKFKEAAISMPRAATTWMTTGMPAPLVWYLPMNFAN